MKKIVFTQIDFDGKIIETSFKDDRLKKFMPFDRIATNSKGNVEFFMSATGGDPAYIILEYNPVDQSVKLHNFKMYKDKYSGSTTYLGKRKDEVYFINVIANILVDSTQACVFAVNEKMELRIVEKFKFPTKNAHDALQSATRIDPYTDDESNKSILFVLSFSTFDGKIPKILDAKMDARPTYKFFRLEDDDHFSILDFDPEKHPDLRGEYKLYYEDDQKDDITSLIMVEKDFSISVCHSDFKTPLDKLEIQKFPALNVPNLALREEEYSTCTKQQQIAGKAPSKSVTTAWPS